MVPLQLLIFPDHGKTISPIVLIHYPMISTQGGEIDHDTGFCIFGALFRVLLMIAAHVNDMHMLFGYFWDVLNLQGSGFRGRCQVCRRPRYLSFQSSHKCTLRY